MSPEVNPLYNSYREPDRDKNKLNLFYKKNPLDVLKNSYNRIRDAVQQFKPSNLYNIQLKFNPAYASNYRSPHTANDYDRKASISDNYKFRLVQP